MVRSRRRAFLVFVLCALPVLHASGNAGQTRNTQLPSVWVLATGGTIAGRGASSTSLTEYRSGTLLGEDLVNAVPEIKEYANVKVEQVLNIPSQDITLNDWIKLANRINAIFATDSEASGIVVTHGTNTIEETAYFLNLTVKDARPVVIVGAQRPATAISADGPLNLLDAIRTAASGAAKDKGVLVVMNEEINGAREVTKTDTYRVETFRAPELGFLGYVDADKVAFYRTPTTRHTIHSEFDIRNVSKFPKVEILYSYVEPDAGLIDALIARGTKGIVFAGTGAGNISSFERAVVERLVALPPESRPVIVRSSRTGNGRVIARDEYGYDRMGLIPADTLSPQKARILLMLALTKTNDPKEIMRMFSEY